ncbi:methylmalonyl-CoA mutase family protein [Actinomycetes bacterium M1A6_2h]
MADSTPDTGVDKHGAPDAAFTAWQGAVAGVLAKSRRVDADTLPEHPESLLASTTYDDITVNPLYGPRDARPEVPLPGTFPFVRGRDASRDVARGWLVAGSVGVGETDPTAINSLILNGLENGISALWLGVDSVAPSDLRHILAGVLLDLAPITLDAGERLVDFADALVGLLDSANDIADRTAVDVRLAASPLTDRFAGSTGVGIDDAIALAQMGSGRTESVRAITVDGTVFHDAGAGDAQEVGLAVAAGLDYLRSLTGAGLTAAQALSQIEFRLAATDGQFDTIAKFRAARRVWARVAQVCGAPGSGNAPQHAVTSAAMMAQRDPWVNMLRTTLAAFGAGVGGADAVTVLPFDVSLPPGALGVSRSFSNRIARNTQLLLLEESHLGRVLDPAAGSWYVEDLTDKMAAAAWSVLQDVESEGGYTAALESGFVRAAVNTTREQRASDIAHRRTAVTGVNEFPNLAEKPLPEGLAPAAGTTRYAEQFEALRDRSDRVLEQTGSRPQVFLAPLGSVAEHNVRTTFASNLLASGGIQALDPGAVADLGAAAREAGASVAVLCGTDRRYADDGVEAVRTLRRAGIERVLLAGPEKAFADAPDDGRPDGYLTAKIDAVAALTELMDQLTSTFDRSPA